MKLIEDRLELKEIVESFDGLDIVIRDFDKDLAKIASEIRPLTRKFGLSLGDRSCLALRLQKMQLQ